MQKSSYYLNQPFPKLKSQISWTHETRINNSHIYFVFVIRIFACTYDTKLLISPPFLNFDIFNCNIWHVFIYNNHLQIRIKCKHWNVCFVRWPVYLVSIRSCLSRWETIIWMLKSGHSLTNPAKHGITWNISRNHSFMILQLIMSYALVFSSWIIQVCFVFPPVIYPFVLLLLSFSLFLFLL